MNKLKFCIIESPVGLLKLVANDDGLVAILWENDIEDRVRLLPMEETLNHPLLKKTEKQLNEYFNHQRVNFDIPMQLNGTPFQRSVWQTLLEISYGNTWTYKQVAERIGRPKAVRAVGTAIGRNPISIIIPCHRVIGTNGKLTGFAGGLNIKQILLNIENTPFPLENRKFLQKNVC